MTRWWMAGRYNMLHNNESRAWIVCPYCKDVHECSSVHDFLQHYADVHSDREGLLSVDLLLARTAIWRNEQIVKTTTHEGRVYWNPFIVGNRPAIGNWIS